MTDDGIPPKVKTFLADNIDSVVQLEALLLLHARPEQALAPADLARELRIDAAWAEPRLRQLCARRILVCEEASEERYRYWPGSEELKQTIDELTACYATRRVSVIALIFSKPPSPLQHFADAFRIRKEKTDG